MFTEKGNASLMAILAIAAVLVFIIVTSLASFQNKLFQSLYPKKIPKLSLFSPSFIPGLKVHHSPSQQGRLTTGKINKYQ